MQESIRRGAAPPILAAITASTLAGVGAVAWIGRTRSPWLVGASVAAAIVLLAALLAQLGAVVAEQPHAVWHPLAGWLIPAVVAAALLGPLAAVDAAQPVALPSGSPAGTVRDFLGTIVNEDGVGACRFLTPRARQELAAPSPRSTDCQIVLGTAALRLGGAAVNSDGELDRLHYAVRADGRDRVVTVSSRERDVTFGLRPATAGELARFMAPATPWRISSDLRALGRGAAGGPTTRQT